MNVKDILYNIREERDSQKLDQAFMARELDLSVKAYSDIETGKSKLSVERLLEIAKILKKPMNRFVPSENNYVFENSPHSAGYGHNYNSDGYKEALKAMEESLRAKDELIEYLKGQAAKSRR